MLVLLKPESAGPHHDHPGTARSGNPLGRFQRGFERGFVRLRTRYQALLATTLERRRIFVPLFLAAMVASLVLVPLLGRDFFPSVDSGQIALHVRAPVGTRIEETSATFAKVEKRIRGIIPPDQIKSVVDNIGLSSAPLNNIYANRSEERRGGKECVSTCRSRWAPYH